MEKVIVEEPSIAVIQEESLKTQTNEVVSSIIPQYNYDNNDGGCIDRPMMLVWLVTWLIFGFN